MYKRIVLLVLGFVMAAAVGCTAETLPAPDAPTLEPTAIPVEADAPTVDVTETKAPTVEPTAEPVVVDTPTAETIDEILDSELLETTQQSASATPFLEEAPQLELNPVKPGPEQAQRISFARHDLAERLGVDIADIEVTAYEEAIWRDGSLGCPQPGMMYTQALVDGYLIQLVVDGQAYNYHGANGRDPFLCIKDGGESGTLPGIERGGFQATPPPSDEDI